MVKKPALPQVEKPVTGVKRGLPVAGQALLRILQLSVVFTLLAFLGMSGTRHVAANASDNWLHLPPDILASIHASPPQVAYTLQALPSQGVDVILTDKLFKVCARYPVEIQPYIYVLNVQTGLSVSLRAEDAVPAASVIKLPILASLFSHIAQGDINPTETRWAFQEIHRASGSGDLQYQKAGQVLTVQRLAEKMIQISDNSTSNIILDNLGGMDSLNTQWRQWGLTHTHLSNWLPDLRGTNTISMRDMACLLYNLTLTDSWLPVAQKQAMTQILLGTANKRLLVAGVPVGTPVAHKTGDIGTIVGDVGTVSISSPVKDQPPQDVIVCVMVKRPRNHPMGRQLVRDVMRTVYDHTASPIIMSSK